MLLALVAFPPGHALLTTAAAISKYASSDPCVDPTAVTYDPAAVLMFDDRCTFRAAVSVQQTNEGLIVEVTLEFAQGGVHLLLECTEVRAIGFPGRGFTERPHCALGDGLA